MSDVTWTRFVRLWRAVGRQAVEQKRWSPEHIRALIAAHPLPWRVEQDWTFEVLASDGACVASFMLAADAHEYVQIAVDL